LRSYTQASLYIHIPFCDSFCDYCDFYSVIKETYSDDYTDVYLFSIIKDIKSQIEYFGIKEIPSVYIGGGTPSVLGKKIRILLDELKNITDCTLIEFTIEANPESINEEFLGICRDGGVNRLSLGVQTFHEPSLIAVNRGIYRKDFPKIRKSIKKEEKIALAAEYFPNSLSVDLITGLPFQDDEVIQNDIKKVMEYNPAHVSLYSLSVESGTILEDNVRNKIINMPKADFADHLWLYGKEILEKEGFEHYEISNFAVKGKQCLHNRRYWKMQNWIAAGPAASGTMINDDTGTAERYTYSQDIDNYIKEPCIQKAVCEEIDKMSLIKESLLMGFRCKGGPNPELFKQRFGSSVEDYIPKTLKKWEGNEKMLFLNQFLKEAFEELGTRQG